MNSTKGTPSVRYPLTIEGDKIFIDVPSLNEQLYVVGIIGTIIIFIFSLVMYITTRDIKISLFLWGICFVIDIYIYCFKSKYIFNKRTNKVMKEGMCFLIPFSKEICNFSDLSVLGVIGYSVESTQRNGIRKYKQTKQVQYIYQLVFATKQKPKKFIKIASTFGIQKQLKLNELNSAGRQLSDMMEIQFIEGNLLETMIATNSSNGITYKRDKIYASFIEAWLGTQNK